VCDLNGGARQCRSDLVCTQAAGGKSMMRRMVLRAQHPNVIFVKSFVGCCVDADSSAVCLRAPTTTSEGQTPMPTVILAPARSCDLGSCRLTRMMILFFADQRSTLPVCRFRVLPQRLIIVPYLNDRRARGRRVRPAKATVRFLARLGTHNA
jgi:hypothetical protein